jgi:hypothetical protein
VASYAAIQGVMAAIQGVLSENLPTELTGASSPGGESVSGSVKLFGSQDFKNPPTGDYLALWLYRISVDPTVPGGYRRALPGTSKTAEIPLMLHFLLIAMGSSAFAEISLMGWAFQQLAINPVIGADRLAAQIPPAAGAAPLSFDWDESDDVQVSTEELTREELMRIWDTLPMKYCLTVPYVARGLRVVLQPDMRQYAPVLDRALVMGEST